MSYETHDFLQGSDQWHANRAQCYNASELAAAAGESSKTKRNDLIASIATGTEKQFSKWVLENVIEPGHRFEALARPLAEEFIGEPLFPVSMSRAVPGLSKRLGASVDGKTMDDRTNWEHKRLNATLAAALKEGTIPCEYHYQMEQGMLVDGAERCLFTASDWDENDNLIAVYHVWYEPNPELRARIVPIWKQVEQDAASYQHVEVIPAAVAAPTEGFGALVLQVEGRVVACNIDAFRAGASAFLNRLPKPEELNSDQDFANAESAGKACSEAESKIKAAKDAGLAQMEGVDTVFRVADQIVAEIKAARIALEKTVEVRKASIRSEIVQSGKDGLAEHISTLNKRLGRVQMPAINADFLAAIKGKRTVESLRNAVDTVLANAKITANDIADKIQINLATLDENKEHVFLFNDVATLAMKAPDDLSSVIKLRIAEHNAEQQRKLDAERERIRAEEQARAQREAEERAAAEKREADRIAADELRRLDSERQQAQPVTLPDVLSAAAPSAIAEMMKTPVISTAPVSPIKPGAEQVEQDTARKIAGLVTEMTADEQKLVLHYCERLIEQREEAA